MCHVALGFQKELACHSELSSYTLPGGQVITVGDERIRCAEALFSPQMMGLESPGIQQVVFSSISKSDLDLRREMVSEVHGVLSIVDHTSPLQSVWQHCAVGRHQLDGGPGRKAGPRPASTGNGQAYGGGGGGGGFW